MANMDSAQPLMAESLTLRWMQISGRSPDCGSPGEPIAARLSGFSRGGGMKLTHPNRPAFQVPLCIDCNHKVTMTCVSRVIAILASALILTACNLGAGAINYKSNHDIPSTLREEMSRKGEAYVAAVQHGDHEAIKALMTDEAWAAIVAQPGIERFIPMVQAMTRGPLSVEEQHYITGKIAGTFKPTLVLTEPEPHTLILPAVPGEAYFLLLKVDQEYREAALGLFFTKTSGDWKVQMVWSGGLLSVGGRRAHAWTDEARRLMDSNLAIPAVLRLKAASQCLRPIPTFQYGFEGGAREFDRRVQEKMKTDFKLPMRVDEVPGQPSLIDLDVSYGKGTLVPVVVFLTSTPLESTALLEEQASRIAETLPHRLPGFCRDGRIYMLVGYNEAPTDPKKMYTRYGFEKPCP